MRVVVLDTSVLLHLDDVQRLDLLGEFEDLDFVFPGEVWEEVERPDRRRRLCEAVRQRWARREPLDLGQDQILKAAALDLGVDHGEAACFALAKSRGWLCATDDQKAMRRVTGWLDRSRFLTTPGLVLLAIRRGILDVATADAFIPVWAANRFRVAFSSFHGL